MPDAQSEIHIAFEVLPETLSQLAQLDAEDHADLIGAFTSVLYGSKQTEVEALLEGPVGRPSIPVSNRGVPELVDCWSRVLAAVQAYNAIGTGLTLVTRSTDPLVPQEPHCVDWELVDGQRKMVVNYGVELTFAGRTEPVYRVSNAAGVARQVLALGHAAVAVPVVPVSP